MKYIVTLAETDDGAWAIHDGTGRQVWASRHFSTACYRVAADLDDQAQKAAWGQSLTSPAAQRRARAQANAWAAKDARTGQR